MASDKTLLGDVCAHCIRQDNTSAYPRIGIAFVERDRDDPEQQRISLKIDTLPIATAGWTGWINIFKRSAQHD